MLRSLSIAAATVTGCAALLVGAPALADSQVTVRGTGFPEGRLAQMSMVGCATLYDRTTEPLAPFIGRGPEPGAPLGKRSLGYDLQGGNAVGSLHYVPSMLQTSTAELSVHAEGGAEGVAYAGYQEPADAGTTLVWIGRAELAAPAGTWTRVLATDQTYTWTKYDMVTREVVGADDEAAAPTGRVADFAAEHGGDGPGFYTIGFGCDGAKFSMDAWRIGPSGDVTSYDLEGLTTTTAIAGSSQRIEAGEEVILNGRVRLGRGDRLRHGTLRLEARPVGGREFELVEVLDVAAGDPSVVVRPRESTVYRWRFVDRPLAEGSTSSLFVVTVLAAQDPPELPEAPGPTETPSPQEPGAPSESPPASDPPSPPPATQSSEPTEPSEPSEPSEPTEPAGASEPAEGPGPSSPAESGTSSPAQPGASP